METTAAAEQASSLTGLINFITPEKRSHRGRIVRLTRDGVVVSIPASDVTIGLSDKITGIEISLQNKTYSAPEATVTSTINTGVEVVCELSFGSSFLRIPSADADMEEVFWEESIEEFFRLANDSLKLPAGFKNAALNLESFFDELKTMLDQFEIQLRLRHPKGDLVFNEALFKKRAKRLLAAFNKLHDRLETEARRMPEVDGPLATRFLRKRLQPFFLCSPFGYQTCLKPLGYAGDYQSVNMIVGNQLQGSTLFGRFMNWLLLSQAPSEAHRNRIELILHRLISETARVVREGRRARVLSIGCGPACEIQRFIEESPLSTDMDVTLVDFNDETLAHARSRIEEIMGKKNRTPGLKLVKQSVVQFLKRVPKFVESGEKPEFDFVYCAGLLDYFNDRMCRELISRFHAWTADEGLMMVTNVATYKPFKYMLDSMLEWRLQYRDSTRLLDLAPETAPGESVGVLGDDTSVNLFLEIRRTARVTPS